MLAEIDTPGKENHTEQRIHDLMYFFPYLGHTSVISKAYPEHVACAESTPWSSFANGTFKSN